MFAHLGTNCRGRIPSLNATNPDNGHLRQGPFFNLPDIDKEKRSNATLKRWAHAGDWSDYHTCPNDQSRPSGYHMMLLYTFPDLLLPAEPPRSLAETIPDYCSPMFLGKPHSLDSWVSKRRVLHETKGCSIVSQPYSPLREAQTGGLKFKVCDPRNPYTTNCLGAAM